MLGAAATGSRDPLPAHLVPYLLNRALGTFNRRWLEHLRRHGVTVARWQVLAILAEYDGARAGQIADMAAAEQPVTSRVIEQMERDGLVARRPSPHDRRAVEVWLTRRGRGVYDDLLPEAEALVTTALDGLTRPALRHLVEALVTLVDNLEPAASPEENR